ncbi:MAG TPA: dTMP kinase [Bacillales bacterium]|nr:dTMP kinase [Bacillales bacterium]
MGGLFITFEGPDGSGKSTQIGLLSEHLKCRGIPHVVTREPGGTVISDKIRNILLDPDHGEMVNETEVLLYAASRAQHVHEVILPALRRNCVVLCDRFVDASLAYQGYGLGIDAGKVAAISRFATGGLVPDRSYFFDLSPEEGRRRLANRRGMDRIEQKALKYHERVREGFHQLYQNDPERIVLINGEAARERIFAEVRNDFEKLWLPFAEGAGVNGDEVNHGGHSR